MPLLAFVMAVLYVPEIPAAATGGRWWVLALGAACLVWDPRFRIKPTVSHWMGLGLLVWMGAGFFLSASPADTLGETWQWIVAAVLFCVAAEIDDRTLDDTFRALAVGVTISALYSIPQALGYQPVLSLMGANTPVGLFLSTNMLTEISVVALIGAVGVRFWWGAPGPALCLLLSTGEREGMFMLLAAAAAYLLLKLPGTGRATLLASLVLAAAWLWSMGYLEHDHWLTHMEDRFEIWRWTALRVNPVGWGLGSFGELTSYEFSHNEFLQYAFELGAGVLFLIGILTDAISAKRTYPRVALAALAAACLVWFPLHLPGTLFLGALLAGYLCGVRGRARRAERARGTHVLQSGEHELEPLWVGAFQSADAGRVHLSSGQEPAARSPRLCSSLSGSGGTL